MLIYFVRHGSTEHNKDDRFQTAATPLSPQGKVEAALLVERLRQSSIKRIYTSTMLRAVQTANIIANELAIPITTTALLEEAKRPLAVRGKSKADPAVIAIMSEIKAHSREPDWAHSDEENYFKLKARAEEAIQLFLESRDREILVVTHGEILRMILTLLAFGHNSTPEIFEKMSSTFATSNAGLTIVTRDHRGWYIRTWNEESHLSTVRYEYGQDIISEPT